MDRFADSLKGWFRGLIEGRHRMLWLVMFLFSVMSIVDIAAAPALKFPLWLRIVYTVLVSSFKASLLSLIFAPMLERGKLLRALAWTLMAVYGLAAAINCFSAVFYGFGISRKLILIFAQTNVSEASQFAVGVGENLRALASQPPLYAMVFAVVAIYLLLRRCGRRTYLSVVASLSLGGLVALGWYGVSHTYGRTAHSLALRTVKYGREVREWDRRYRELQRQKRPLPDAESVRSGHLAETVVFVIGESASRGHHQIYGYPLPTTPRMHAMRDSLFIYRDAIASSHSTSGNLERILSLKYDDTTAEDGLEFPLVVDLFKAAGYKTFWLSNQERTGSVSNTSGVMAMNADVIEYVGAENSEDALAQRFDGALVPRLDKALADTASCKFIFLHLLGSHVQYGERYPVDFDRFKGRDVMEALRRPWLDEERAATVAQYDNSILYTDWLLSEIIRRIARLRGGAAMIYLSDHGENVYDEGGYRGRGEKYVRVPMLVYLNAGYRHAWPDIVERLRKSLALPISTANVEHQIMTLTGTGYKRYDASRDALSPDFVRRRRYVDERPWRYEGCDDKNDK